MKSIINPRHTTNAKPRIYRGAVSLSKPPVDQRGNTTQGRQGVVQCPECPAEVTLKKADAGNAGFDGIKQGDLILSRHRPGGGRVSFKRGDVICKGSGTKP